MESGQPAFESARSHAWFTTVGISAAAGMQVVCAASLVVERLWFPDWDVDESMAAGVFGLVVASSALVALIAMVVAAVGYLLWIHRATKNSVTLGRGLVRTSPRMAVWCWFIPFVHLFKPYQIVRALHEMSAPEGVPSDPAARFAWIFPVWWATWLVHSMLGNLSFRYAFSDDPGEQSSILWLDLACTPFYVVSAVLALTIVWSIEARHHALVEEERTPSP
jgi:hypothetical protein